MGVDEGNLQVIDVDVILKNCPILLWLHRPTLSLLPPLYVKTSRLILKKHRLRQAVVFSPNPSLCSTLFVLRSMSVLTFC